jgi:hypothetical protein
MWEVTKYETVSIGKFLCHSTGNETQNLSFIRWVKYRHDIRRRQILGPTTKQGIHTARRQ